MSESERTLAVVRRRLLTAAATAWLALAAAGCAPATDSAPVAAEAGDQAPVLPTPTATVEPPATSATPKPAAVPPAPAWPAPTPPPAESAPDTAMDLLATLDVKGRAPKTGYDRDLFGASWADVDRNGCDTRNDILARDLTGETFKPGTRDCVVISGQLADPYTGQVLTFAKANASAVQIDHVVALANAWQTGAQQWPAERRVAFANDPLNLLAVDGPTNASKGDGDAATWLPPSKGYRCQMVARQTAVKAKYGLWVVPPERDAIARVLTPCPDEPAPGDGTLGVAAVPAPVDPAQPPPAPPAAAPPAPAPASAGGDADPQFGSCKEALAKGYGPYLQGQDPEYGWYRDGDSDGSVCE